jgi:L-ascorbate metabolism protein UlaG (beta-lactamase superfamily)
MARLAAIAVVTLACVVFSSAVTAQQPPSQMTIAADGGTIVVTPLTHASVQIEFAGKVIQIDPAMGDMLKAKPADLILVTDVHPDHLNPGRIRRLRKTGTPVVMPEAAKAQTRDDVTAPVETMSNGDAKIIAGVRIEAVPMYNIAHLDGNEPFHTKGRGNGYVITLGSRRVYFAGDTECVPEISGLTNIDAAFLPMNLPFTMAPLEAAECAKSFRPVVAVPYHYQGADPQAFVAALEGSGIQVRMLDWYPAIERPDVVAVPMPGRLVDIGGRKLHLFCSGSGSPTVVLQGAPFVLDWSFVQPEIAKRHRVCSFDPAGAGWSERSGNPDATAFDVSDVHAALAAAGEKPPFVLVGAGPGATASRWFQVQFPREVAGIVFVDGVHEDSAIVPVDDRPAPLWSVSQEQLRTIVDQFTAGRQGPARPATPEEDAPLDRLPADVLTTRVTFQLRRDRVLASPSADLLFAMLDSDRSVFTRLHDAAAASPTPLGNLPVVSLRASVDIDAPFKAVQAGLVRLSSNGTERIVARSGSEIHLYEPSSVVLAIEDVVESARSGAPVRVR